MGDGQGIRERSNVTCVRGRLNVHHGTCRARSGFEGFLLGPARTAGSRLSI